MKCHCFVDHIFRERGGRETHSDSSSMYLHKWRCSYGNLQSVVSGVRRTPWTPTMETGWFLTPWALQALTQLRMSNFAPELKQVCCHTAKPWLAGQAGEKFCMAAAPTWALQIETKPHASSRPFRDVSVESIGGISDLWAGLWGFPGFWLCVVFMTTVLPCCINTVGSISIIPLPTVKASVIRCVNHLMT